PLPGETPDALRHFTRRAALAGDLAARGLYDLGQHRFTTETPTLPPTTPPTHIDHTYRETFHRGASLFAVSENRLRVGLFGAGPNHPDHPDHSTHPHDTTTIAGPSHTTPTPTNGDGGTARSDQREHRAEQVSPSAPALPAHSANPPGSHNSPTLAGSSNPSRQAGGKTPLHSDPVWAARISRAGQHPRVRTVNALTDEEIAAWWELLPPAARNQLAILANNAADFTRLQPGGDRQALKCRLTFAGAFSLLSMWKPDEAISTTDLLRGVHELTPGPRFREYDEREKVAFHEGASRQALAAGIPKLGLPGGAPPTETRIPLPPSHAGPSSRAQPTTRRQTAGPGEPAPTGRPQETAPTTPSNPKRAWGSPDPSPQPSPLTSRHKRLRPGTPEETTHSPVRTDPGPAGSIAGQDALAVAVELMAKFGITTENGQPHASDPLTRDVALRYTLAKKSLGTVITNDTQLEVVARNAAAEPIKARTEAFETAIELMKEHKIAL
ncbi:hypothetical protein AB0O11_39335, partial [Kitasatospora sp. NPDC093102]